MGIVNKKIKVLIIDDSAVVRNVLSKKLSEFIDIDVVGTAADPYIGRDKIVYLRPDVILLDVEMPRMDGLTFLKILMKHHPMPVIVVSSLGQKGGEVAITALELGAIDVVAKPGESYNIKDMSVQLAEKIRAASKICVNKKQTNTLSAVKKGSNSILTKTTNKIIAIGASTGGTEAIKQIITNLPSNMPPIMIVQHMPAYFTKSFADRLDSLSNLLVKEAEDEEILSTGKAVVAPGNFHMSLRRSGARYYLKVEDGPLVHYQRPAVDILFESVAKFAGKNSIGVLLTGMGRDGANGLLQMREAGAFTIAQNEDSCVVYGMPKEAVALNAASKVLPLNSIASELVNLCKE